MKHSVSSEGKEGTEVLNLVFYIFFELDVVSFDKSPKWEIQGYCTVCLFLIVKHIFKYLFTSTLWVIYDS